MSIFAENLFFLRRTKQNLSQAKLSNAIGITASSYRRYEEGLSDPNLDTLVKISNYFQIATDVLLRVDLRSTDTEKLIKLDNNRLILPITIDSNDKDIIQIVTQEASAGYLSGYADSEFIQNLQSIHLPIQQPGIYRAFPIRGDSMLPKVESGSYIIGRYMEDYTTIKNGKTYVFITQEEGIVYKRAYWSNKLLELHSDNKAFEPYSIHPKDLIEAWEYHSLWTLSDDLPVELDEETMIRILRSVQTS